MGRLLKEMFWFESGADSRTGLKHSQNEDSFLAESEWGLFAVADGMSQPAGGAMASSAALETLRQVVRPRAAVAAPEPELAEAARAANFVIYDHGSRHPDCLGMGTTLVALRLDAVGGQAEFVNVGDSRCYLFRRNKIECLTRDENLVDEGFKRLLRAVGIDSDLDVAAENLLLEDGDVLLLCSDGVSDVVTDAELLNFARRAALPATSLARLAEELVAYALARGSTDDRTAVWVRCRVEGDTP